MPALRAITPLSTALGLMRQLRSLTFVLFFLLAAGCLYQPNSELTGGHGVVALGDAPVSGAAVSISDIGGTLSAVTDAGGHFVIDVPSDKSLYLAMANPIRHEVVVSVQKDGEVLGEWTFEKHVLGPNYFDFGVLEADKRPDQSFKPTPSARLGSRR